ncbi:MAG: phosphoglycerate kinase [Anaerolineales bacterium]|jgi:phosphoglycerate kinase
MFQKKTVRDVSLSGRRALVRVDFNVPLKDGQVADDTRIQAALPTLEYMMEHGASLVLCSHLGRPKGQVVPGLSLRPVAVHLSNLIGKQVAFVDDCVGDQALRAAQALEPGDVLLLENTRFHPEERKNDPGFAAQLASLGELFVNDAFGSAHRAHASTEGVTHHLPAVAGFLMEKELNYLGQALAEPSRPFLAILGGAKISDKIEVVESLLKQADKLLVGGGMANTFLAAQGMDMASSLVEEQAKEVALDLLGKAKGRLLLPVDVVVAEEFAADAAHRVVDPGEVPSGWQVLDIGPRTVETFRLAMKDAAMLFWNGPMGVFEFPAFAEGTREIAKAVAESQATTIVCGGDSVAAVRQEGYADRIDHVSTGGGASLEFLVGKPLPGVEALLDREAPADKPAA